MVEPGMRMSRNAVSWSPQENAYKLKSSPPSWLKVEARKEVREIGPVYTASILFVCTGNICRSAFAACASQKMLHSDHISVGSAGIGALVGEPIDPIVASIADQLELQTDKHVSRQLTGRQLKNVDLVLIFGPEHYQWILDNYPEQIRKVVPLQRFVTTAELIPASDRRTWDKLIEKVSYGTKEFTEDDWIKDPYRHSKKTYLEVMSCIWRCVQRMSVLLDSATPQECSQVSAGESTKYVRL